MAAVEKYTDDTEILFQLRHDFRTSPFPSRNSEIVSELSKNNYFLHPENHGRSVEECLDYYKRLINDSYIYGKNSDRDICRCMQWIIQAPDDLAPEKKQAFFLSSYEYLTSIYGEENVVAAVVHVDEIMVDKKGNRISKDHLHYLVVPRVKNPKYVSLKDKFTNGINKLRKNDNSILADNLNIKKLGSSIYPYYKKEQTKNQTISQIAKNLECKYAEAKKIFNAVVVKDSEAYKMKLNSDEYTSRRKLHEFHPGLQKFLEERGIHCTVAFKAQGIERTTSYTVAEAKIVTRVTGLSVEQIKDLEIEKEILQEQVNSLSQEIEKQEIEQNKDIETSGWGNTSGWGKDRGTKEWEKEY